jgi:hypothetical protein
MTDRVLDVEQGDLLTAAAVLQRLGLALLEDLFDAGSGLTHERWFGSSDVRVFGRARISRLGWRRLAVRIAPPVRDAVAGKGRWGLGASRPRQMRWSPATARARLAIDYHGIEGLRIPDGLLPLIGRTAWDAPEFRLQAATLVADHVRSRLVFPLSRLPAPRVAAPVVWMLVATSRVPMPLAARLGVAYRQETRAIERLQRFARRALDDMAMPNDFWSHWIAWHVERRFGIGLELPPEWLSPLRLVQSRIGPAADQVRWTSPEALTAAYAAWYPREKERRRVRVEPGS